MDTLEQAQASGDPLKQLVAIETAKVRIADMQMSGNSDHPYAGMVRAFMAKFTNEFAAEMAARGYAVA